MNDALELFDQVRNVQFKHFEDAAAEIPVFRIVENSTEDWNRKAILQNTKMFIEIHGRQPNDYEEVRRWLKENKENLSAANTKDFGYTI